MDFFRSLPPDLQFLAAAMVGCIVLALFSGNQKTEKRYVIALVVLAAAGAYRYNEATADDPSRSSVAAPSAPRPVAPAPVHKPLVSTFAR
ncbi:MAG: hypothetical protein ACO1PB_06090 [Ramlibacter sp.]